MGILQKMPRILNRVKRCFHPGGPRSTPAFRKYVVLTAPNKMRGQGPIEQGAIMKGLRGSITIVKTVERDRSRETTIAIKSLIWQTPVRRGETLIEPLGCS